MQSDKNVFIQGKKDTQGWGKSRKNVTVALSRVPFRVKERWDLTASYHRNKRRTEPAAAAAQQFPAIKT